MIMWKEKDTKELILLDHLRNDLEVLGDLIFKTECFVHKIFWASTLKGLHNK